MVPVFICPNCRTRSVDVDGYEGFTSNAPQCRNCGFGFLFQLLEDDYPAPSTGFVVCDRDARVLAVGRGVFELTGYREADLIGRDVSSALALSDTTPLELVREWGVRRLGQELEVRTRAGIVKPVRRRPLPGIRRGRRRSSSRSPAAERAMDEPSPEIWLARHGETTWSRDWLHTSVTDVPLTERGVEQARELGHRLAGRSFALVLTSPRLRARRTAELAGFPDAMVDDDLVEWHYGSYEGVSTAEIRATVPGWTVWTTRPPEARRPTTSVLAPTACSSAPAQPAETSSCSATRTPCVSSPHAGSAWERRTAVCSGSTRGRSPCSATSARRR